MKKISPALRLRVRRLAPTVTSYMHNELWHAERIDLLEEVSETSYFEVSHTGGGCTALGLDIDHDRRFILAADCEVPSQWTDAEGNGAGLCMDTQWGGGQGWQLSFDSFREAFDFARSFFAEVPLDADDADKGAAFERMLAEAIRRGATQY